MYYIKLFTTIAFLEGLPYHQRSPYGYEKNAPNSHTDGLLHLLGLLYSQEYLHLHRKTATKAKVGEDLKVAMDQNELHAIRGKS